MDPETLATLGTRQRKLKGQSRMDPETLATLGTRHRKLKGQSRMDPETLATLGTLDEDKQNKQHNTETKKLSNTDPTKNQE
jgi:hypothetical protein